MICKHRDDSMRKRWFFLFTRHDYFLRPAYLTDSPNRNNAQPLLRKIERQYLNGYLSFINQKDAVEMLLTVESFLFTHALLEDRTYQP